MLPALSYVINHASKCMSKGNNICITWHVNKEISGHRPEGYNIAKNEKRWYCKFWNYSGRNFFLPQSLSTCLYSVSTNSQNICLLAVSTGSQIACLLPENADSQWTCLLPERAWQAKCWPIAWRCLQPKCLPLRQYTSSFAVSTLR